MPAVQGALLDLARHFAGANSIGARSYAEFRQGTTRAEWALHERQAVGAIDEFIQALPISGTSCSAVRLAAQWTDAHT